MASLPTSSPALLRPGGVHFLPNEVGEVARSAGGVGSPASPTPPSAYDADTFPRGARGGEASC